ncbi:conjugal transfer pilus assembly protein TraK [Vibrio crassostreae]|nr:conjugal transfer pilus assembly protein TraK [Vibrio crassostreae]CAK2769613.1 conjugal transfer pilus assembly protein TraK [Vibrio crassostreae]CAK3222477.1 conjugal transfer pilus assembly protein TraK [Vibrio crassostreae]CAK3838732.1 conjugal transfer pilus assembly protein TraK [Vibrio crassostreae]
MKNSHQLARYTTLICATLSFGAMANQNVIPIEPVGSKVERQTTQPENKAAVAAMVDQVVKSLPTDKQESLSQFTPVNDPAAKQPIVSTNSVDEFGRVTQSDKNVIVATPSAAIPPKPSLTAFERMQRQMAKKFKPVQKYKLRPSDNITLPAAKYILNSIRTSFKEINIRSSDPNVVMKVDGSFIYFTSNNDAPFNIIMFEKGVPETQVNLTIWPLDVMPAMVQVDVRYNKALQAKVNRVLASKEQDKIEQEKRIQDMESELAIASDPEVKSSAYVEGINKLFAQTAGKATPTGFDLQTNIPRDALRPCRFGTYAETKQRLISSRRIVDIVLVENVTNRNVVLREQDCWVDDDVIATGILNKATLKPSEKTEVYVLRDRLYYQRMHSRNERPSLLD